MHCLLLSFLETRYYTHLMDSSSCKGGGNVAYEICTWVLTYAYPLGGASRSSLLCLIKT